MNIRLAALVACCSLFVADPASAGRASTKAPPAQPVDDVHVPEPVVAPPRVVGGIQESALTQIADIEAQKKTFTAAEAKLSSSLAFRTRLAAGQPVAAPLATAGVLSALPSDDEAVDIGAVVTPALLQLIAAQGGRVKASSTQYGRIDAVLPLGRIAAIAADANVRWIREAANPMLNVGALTSQGYTTHRAKEVVEAASPITGAGVKVGVLSDSANAARVSALITSGDLGPGTTVLDAGPANGTDEGAAMMEIVQDMAPGAQVYFATAFTSEVSFANNIAALASAGCSIIVDDVTYFDEGAFQDGIIAQAVNAFVAGGGVYFSSAANSGNLTSGTSGTWEGDFLDGGAAAAPILEAGQLHNFGTAGSPQNFDILNAGSKFISLKWSDPLSGSTNDYDLFILNSAGTAVVASSVGLQAGTQDPFEFVSGTFTTGQRIVVVKFGGAARALHIDTNRSRLSIATAGATYGHNAGLNTVSLAAAAWDGSPKIGTGPYNATSPFEVFSSDGPRTIFYNPDGSPITPGNVLLGTGGGTNLSKPDITAADGAVSMTPGFLPFFGTSAAAPHAAGIAALVKQAKPTLTGSQIATILRNTAIDISTAGVDRDTGSGIVMAKPAVDAALSSP